MRRLPSPLFFAFLLVPSCADSGSDSIPRAVVWDSAGVRMVQYDTAMWADHRVWALSDEPVLAIGATEGQEPYLFNQIVDVLRLNDGRIVVLNGDPPELRLFDAAGQHVGTSGGRGQGPGEFNFPSAMSHARDSLMVWDAAISRVTVFTASGDYARDFSSADLRGTLGPALMPLGVADNGNLLTVALPRESAIPGGLESGWSTATLVAAAPDGGIDTLAAVPWQQCSPVSASGGRCQRLFIAFGGSGHLVLDRDRIVYARSDRREFKIMGTEGALREIVRSESSPIPVTRAMQQEYMDFLPTYLLGARPRRPENWSFAETLPLFSEFMVGAAGTMWLREYISTEVLPGVPSGAPVPPVVGWTVLDSLGVVAAHVDVPSNFLVKHIGDEYLLGVAIDQLGVERVQMFEMETGN